MKKAPFTLDNYLQAISRELAKRATTYPKILKKLKKANVEYEEYMDTMLAQNRQNILLERVIYIIECKDNIGKDFVQDALNELIRELKMRRRHYPRMVYLKRIDQTIADYELAVWDNLTQWFAKEFLGLDELPITRRNKK